MEINHSIDPKIFLDNSIKNATPKTLSETAEQFEALFVNQLLKQARKSKLSDELFSSQATETYSSMLDQERANQLAKNIDFGIAKALERQFSREDR